MKSSRMYGLLAALLLAPGLSWAQAPTAPAKPAPNAITHPAQKKIGTPSARQYSSSLIVINSRGDSLDGQAQFLNGITTVLTFGPTNRPIHLISRPSDTKTPSGSSAPASSRILEHTILIIRKDSSSISNLVVTLNTFKARERESSP